MSEKEVVQSIGFLRLNWPWVSGIVTGIFVGGYGVLRWFVGINSKVNRIKAVTLDDNWDSKVIAKSDCKDCKEGSEKTQEQILSQIEKSNLLQQETAKNLAVLTGAFNQFVKDQKT